MTFLPASTLTERAIQLLRVQEAGVRARITAALESADPEAGFVVIDAQFSKHLTSELEGLGYDTVYNPSARHTKLFWLTA